MKNRDSRNLRRSPWNWRWLARGVLLLALVASRLALRAQFNPIPLTTDSFNQDVVVERTAPPPVGCATTASMDAGTNNTGFTWYEVGFNSGAPSTGLPAAGATFNHQSVASHRYTMAPSYRTNNAVLIAPGQVLSATLRVTAPTAFPLLSFLAAGGNGGCTIRYTVHYEAGGTGTGTLTVGDWFNGTNPAWTARGRLDAQTFAFNNVSATNPRLYGYDVTVPNSPVASIDFAYVSGSGTAAIFAVSGGNPLGPTWTPLAVTGYNCDLIVEASAPRPVALSTATTASMESGMANTGNTWFERGYDPAHPDGIGLPPPPALR